SFQPRVAGPDHVAQSRSGIRMSSAFLELGRVVWRRLSGPMPFVSSVDICREPAIAQSLVDGLARQAIRVVGEQCIHVLDKGAGAGWTSTSLKNQIVVIGREDQVVGYCHGNSPDSI